MKLLIESSTIIEYLRGNKEVKEVISSAEDFYISSLTVFEVLLGRIEENKILDFLSAFKTLNPTKKDALVGSRIYKRLKDKGKLIGGFDVLISAQAINRDLALLTKDTDFLAVKEEFNELNLVIIN
ncbi:MAG: type II toxin-antitoxin system VapC family toxin [Thermocladium sp.]